MAAFSFKTHEMHLDIAGHAYTVELTNDVIRTMDSVKEKAGAFADNTSVDELLKWTAGAIDSVLGAGASAEIFGKDPQYMAALDVVVYIQSEYNKALLERTK